MIQYKVDEEFYKITGFYTHEELTAYEKGREHESNTLHKWLEDWDGSTNSAMGELLMNKFKSLNENNYKNR